MKDLLFAVLGLISAGIAVWQMISYIGQNSKGEISHVSLIIAIVFGIIAIGLGGVFLAGRVNKQEDIHVTR